jgi:hypothetical protein
MGDKRSEQQQKERDATVAMALRLGFRRADFGNNAVIYIATEDGLIAFADAYKRQAQP